MDTAREYIVEVMDELATITGIDWELGRNYKVGALTWDENDEPGQRGIIKWRYGDITHDEPDKQGTIYTEHQDLEVRLWFAGVDQDASETGTRMLKNNLLAAARIASQGKYLGQLAVGAFRWGEEAHESLGRWLDGTITIPLPVPNVGQTFVTVTTVHADGYFVEPSDLEHEELVCTEDLPVPP